MKKLLITALIALLHVCGYAQTEAPPEDKTEKTGGFKAENLFTGGNLNIGYFSGVTVLGATPQLGYSITQWLDAGIVFGYTYTSEGDVYGNKYRQHIVGPGAFVRIFPVNFLFATAQYEHNFITQKQIIPGAGTFKYHVDVNSLLVGLGYTSGREQGSPYYFFSVAVDVLDNPESPYRDVANQIYPVVNAGFVIPLFQGARRR